MTSLLDDLTEFQQDVSNSFGACWTAVADMASRTAATHWVGPAADRIWNDLDGPHRQLITTQQALDELLGHIGRVIGDIENALAEIARLENSVRHWFSREASILVAGMTPLWAGWQWHPAVLPGSGDPRWLEVGDYLHARGVNV